MGTQKEDTLVSRLSGDLQAGLTALQATGVTYGMWKRLSVDASFAAEIGAHIQSQHRFPNGDGLVVEEELLKLDRNSLWEILINSNQESGVFFDINGLSQEFASLLDIIINEGLRPPKLKSMFSHLLFLTPVIYRETSLYNLEVDLEERGMVPATTADALRFLIKYHGLVPNSKGVWIPGAGIPDRGILYIYREHHGKVHVCLRGDYKFSKEDLVLTKAID